MEDKIKVVLLEPDKLAQAVEIDSSLSGMQNVVGGYIEAFYGFETSDVCLVCNEEGKLMGLPLNRAIYEENTKNILDIIAGPCFICDCSGDDFGSLSEEQILEYTEMFKYPEQFYRDFSGEIIAIPYEPVNETVRDSLSSKIDAAQTQANHDTTQNSAQNFESER